MSVIVVAGTQKGAMLYRSDTRREHWEPIGFQLEGWLVTATARDAGGRTYTSGNVYTSPDLGEHWIRLPGTLPRVLSVEAYAT